jgi:hypothetical protein
MPYREKRPLPHEIVLRRYITSSLTNRNLAINISWPNSAIVKYTANKLIVKQMSPTRHISQGRSPDELGVTDQGA